MNYTSVRAYTDKELLDRVKQLDNFKIIPNKYWIIGVRAKNKVPDTMSDKFYVFYGEKFVKMTTGTTTPGASILKGKWRLFNKQGAFVMKANHWHYNIWMNGLHNGKIKALVQTGAPVVGYRDNDNDNIAEEIGKPYSGWFGINFHLNSYKILRGIVGWFVGGWSAGCQVCNNATDYYEIIDMMKDQKLVSYCLLDEF